MSTKPPDPPRGLLSSPFLVSLVAGGLAGTTVDLSLYPLDTIKTRLQSASGFRAAGGFRNIYKGIGSAAAGSAPGAALFFVTYERLKKLLLPPSADSSSGGGRRARYGWGEAGAHVLAASLGETVACTVRVPTEVVKQRAQALQHPSSLSSLQAILSLRKEQKGGGGKGGRGGWARVGRELYRGWGITVLREVPFTIVQFPVWEALKSWSLARRRRQRRETLILDENTLRKSVLGDDLQQVSALESAFYGSLSGALAGALTTPLDVLKTRMMLGEQRQKLVGLAGKIWREEGWRAFAAGVGPRTAWISVGGAVFLGSYQWASNVLGGSH